MLFLMSTQKIITIEQQPDGTLLCQSQVRVNAHSAVRKISKNQRSKVLTALMLMLKMGAADLTMGHAWNQYAVHATITTNDVGKDVSPCLIRTDLLEIVPQISNNIIIAGVTNSPQFVDNITNQATIRETTKPELNCYPDFIPFIKSICEPASSDCGAWRVNYPHQLTDPNMNSQSPGELDHFKNVFTIRLGSTTYENKGIDELLPQKFVVTLFQRKNGGAMLIIIERMTGTILRSYQFPVRIDEYFNPATNRLGQALAFNRHSSKTSETGFEASVDNLAICFPTSKSWSTGMMIPSYQLKQSTLKEISGVFDASQSYITHITAHYHAEFQASSSKHQFYSGGVLHREGRNNILVSVWDDNYQELDHVYAPNENLVLTGEQMSLTHFAWSVSGISPSDKKYEKVIGLAAITDLSGNVVSQKFLLFWYAPFMLCTNKLQFVIMNLSWDLDPVKTQQMKVIPLDINPMGSLGSLLRVVVYYSTSPDPLNVSQRELPTEQADKRMKSILWSSIAECSQVANPIVSYTTASTKGQFFQNYEVPYPLIDTLTEGQTQYFFDSQPIRQWKMPQYSNLHQTSVVYQTQAGSFSQIGIVKAEDLKPPAENVDEKLIVTLNVKWWGPVNSQLTASSAFQLDPNTQTYPTCVGITYTPTTTTPAMTGYYGTQLLFNDPSQAHITVDSLQAPVSYVCGETDTSKCDFCPQILLWKYASDSTLNRKAPLETQQVYAGNFLAISFLTESTEDYLWTIKPQLTTYQNFVNPQLTEFPFEIIYSHFNYMMFPACKGFCTYSCKSAPTVPSCEGQFVQGQIYKIRKDSSTYKCYRYIGVADNCICDPVSSLSDNSKFRELENCHQPLKSASKLFTITDLVSPLQVTFVKSALPFVVDATMIVSASSGIFVSKTEAYFNSQQSPYVVDWKITDNGNNGQFLLFTNIAADAPPHPFQDYQIRIQDDVSLASFIPGNLLTQTELKQITLDYQVSAIFTIQIKYEGCDGQRISLVSDTVHEVSVQHSESVQVLLSEVDIKGFFTTLVTGVCPILAYEIVQPDGNNPDSTMKKKLLVDERIADSAVVIQIDLKEFTANDPSPTDTVFSYNFNIKATLNNNAVPTIEKSIKINVSFYDCTGKSSNVVSSKKTIGFDVDTDQNNQYTLDFADWFIPQDEKCPILLYYLKIGDTITSANPTQDQMKIYALPDQTTAILNIVAKEKGTYVFYLFALTKNENNVVNVTLNLKLCRRGFADISAPTSYDGNPYFQEVTKEGTVKLRITTENLVNKGDLASLTTNISLGLFQNNDEENCPLTYSVKLVDESQQTTLVIKKEADKVNVQIPLIVLEEKIYTFKVVGVNPQEVEAQTPIIEVTAGPFCSSILAEMMENKDVLKDLSLTVYIWEVANTEALEQTSLIGNLLKNNGLSKPDIGNCPLADPYFIVTSNNKTSSTTRDYYQMTDNLSLMVQKTDILRSSLMLNVSNQGWQDKVKVQLVDIKKQTFDFTVSINVCGDDFNDAEVCLLQKPTKPLVSFSPELRSEVLGGINLDDKWLMFQKNPSDDSLQILFDLGTAQDPDSKDFTITFDIPTGYSAVFALSETQNKITLQINMQAFYESDLMVNFDQEIATSFKIVLNDKLNKVEYTIPVKFAAKKKPEEEKPAEEKNEQIFKQEEQKDTKPTFVPNFNFDAVPQREAMNEPIKIASGSQDKAQRTAPQIASLEISGDGECVVTFSKNMRFPKNWVEQHLRDAQVDEVDLEMVDSENAPLFKFLYEQVQAETPLEQILLPDSDIKIQRLTPISITFNVSFDSLDNPQAISLTDSIQQDMLIVQISKDLIMNGQDGESLVLDASDFDEEDQDNFYMSSTLQPQKVVPTSQSAQSMQGAADSGPSMTANVQILSLAGMLVTQTPPVEMGNNMNNEQVSAASSAMKVIQPGQVNGYNKKMQKASGMDYKTLDFLSARNMTWTSLPPAGDGLKRMGVTQKNAPKILGSTVLGGGAIILTSNVLGPVLESAGMFFEGGTPEVTVSFQQQVLQLKKKYNLSIKAPIVPTINTIIGTIYLKILLGGITNAQNWKYMTWQHFGKDGILSIGDQFAIVFGNMCLALALVLFLMITVNLFYTPPWMFTFGKKAQGVENIIRRQGNHKWFLFSMGQLKTFFIVYIIVFASNPNFSVPQLMLTLVMNPSNLFIGWNLIPLPKVWCLDLTKVAKVADIFAILIIYHQLMMSDVAPPSVDSKIRIGYVILGVGQLKFYLGNVKQAGHDYNIHRKKIDPLVKKLMRYFCCCFIKEKDQVVTNSERFFELNRKQLVHAYQLKYKKNFYKIEKLEFHPDNFNKVAPIEIFTTRTKVKKDPAANMYNIRAEQRLNYQKPGQLSLVLPLKAIDVRETPQNLAIVKEDSELIDESFYESEVIDNPLDTRTVKITHKSAKKHNFKKLTKI